MQKRKLKSNLMKRIFIILLQICVVMCNMQLIKAQEVKNGVIMSGKCHVQTFGNKNAEYRQEDGIGTLVMGTRGFAKRVECININLINNTEFEGNLQYRVHVQSYGWTNWIDAGNDAGTMGKSKRLEAVQMRLTGSLAEHYDVRYKSHIQTYGDEADWSYNGCLSGTTGQSKRLEEIKVQIIPKVENRTPSIMYKSHIQTYGWESGWKRNGDVSGTTGKSKRLEQMSIQLDTGMYSGGITYSAHVQSYGWMPWMNDGELTGTSGQSKRLEAIKIKLTGEIANYYDVYYRVHMQSNGWLAWVKNGDVAGSEGYKARLEAIQVVLIPKSQAMPAENYKGVTQNNSFGYVKKVKPDVYKSGIKEAQAKNYTSVQGSKTAAQILNFNGKTYIDILSSHEYDNYYIGTPYKPYRLIISNGDAWAGKGEAGMNCQGFVWNVLSNAILASGGSLGNMDVENNCVNHAYSNAALKKYTFSSKQAMLTSGVLEKGDIIWQYTSAGVSPFNHIGIYWGNSGTEDVYWHSLGGVSYKGQVFTQNAITTIEALKPVQTYLVIKAGGVRTELSQIGNIVIQNNGENQTTYNVKSGNKIVCTFTTDGNGYGQSGDLVNGNYVLEDTLTGECKTVKVCKAGSSFVYIY